MNDSRVERHLGWVTVNGQEYPREKAADWLDAIKKGLCPFCGAGPFTMVALHVNQRHGMTSNELKDLLGLRVQDSICDPAYSKAMSKRAIELWDGPKMRELAKAPKKGRRTTNAERARVAALRKPPKACVICGAPVPYRKRATCSDECRHQRQVKTGQEVKARQPAPKTVDLICPICGVGFTMRESKLRRQKKSGYAQTVCSLSCAGKSSARRYR